MVQMYSDWLFTVKHYFIHLNQNKNKIMLKNVIHPSPSKTNHCDCIYVIYLTFNKLGQISPSQ